MSTKDKTKAVKLTESDATVVTAIQKKLGIRSVSEVLRMGVRALAREQGISEPQPPQAA